MVHRKIKLPRIVLKRTASGVLFCDVPQIAPYHAKLIYEFDIIHHQTTLRRACEVVTKVRAGEHHNDMGGDA